ncbi:zinc finger-like domain-containing protein [Deinococcus sp. VB343]|uniref:Zinc finger-like domain-containing protein n=1 Tax=Deinococcus sp. VB142 TaxID=3112952 RepID=A0AAU6Q049_9DEIO
MTEHTAARTPAALAEHLGLTVPQLAQRLALLTQTEGMTGAGLTLDAEHLTAAEVLGVLAACPGTAQPEPLPGTDWPSPLNRANMTAAVCNAVSGAYDVLSRAQVLDAKTRRELGTALEQMAAAAQVLAQIEGAPLSLSAAQRMTARALAAGAELYTADTLAQFRAAAAQQNTPPSAAQPEPVPPSNLCPACRGQGEYWAAPYDNPRECPECEGRGVLDVYTPDGPPVCPVCDGSGTPDPDALGVYLAAQAERAASSTPLTPSTPAAEVEP